MRATRQPRTVVVRHARHGPRYRTEPTAGRRGRRRSPPRPASIRPILNRPSGSACWSRGPMSHGAGYVPQSAPSRAAPGGRRGVNCPMPSSRRRIPRHAPSAPCSPRNGAGWCGRPCAGHRDAVPNCCPRCSRRPTPPTEKSRESWVCHRAVWAGSFPLSGMSAENAHIGGCGSRPVGKGAVDNWRNR